jgi:hypothetical protein
VIENFPVEQMIQNIAMLTGLPADELVRESTLEMIGVYTPQYLAAHYEPILQEMEASGDPKKIAEAQKLRTEYQEFSNLGGLNFTESTALVNIDTVDANAGADDNAYKHRVYRYATHEFVHTLVNEPSLLNLAGANLNDVWVEEGLVDHLAERLDQMLPLYGTDVVNSGYIVGSLPAGRMLTAIGGEQAMFRSLVREDWAMIGTIFDDKYGDGAWERVRGAALPLSFNDQANQLQPVFGMLREMGTARDGVVSKLNSQYDDIRLIPVVGTDGIYHGVAVREGELRWKVVNGLLVESVVQDSGPAQLILSVNGREAGTETPTKVKPGYYFSYLGPEYVGSREQTTDADIVDRLLKHSITAANELEIR